jgi:hypothetical protein
MVVILAVAGDATVWTLTIDLRFGTDARRGDRSWIRGDPDRFEGAPKSSLISQEDLPGIGTLPASRR